MDDDEIKKLWNRCVDETPMPTDAGDVAIRLYRMAERSKKPNYCDMEKAAYENHKAFHPDGTTHICYFCDCEKQARASARAELIEKLKDELNNHTLQLTNNKRKLFIETKDMWAAIKKASESLGEHGGLADGIGDKRCGKSNTRQSSSKDAGYKRSASPPSNPKPENALTPTTKEYEDAFKHIFSKPEKPKYTAGQYEGIPDHKNPYKIQEAKDLLAKASKPEKHIDGKSIADCKCPSCTKYREEWSDPEPNNSHCPFCGSTDLGFAREFRLNKDGTEDPATDCAGCNRIFYMRDYRVSK